MRLFNWIAVNGVMLGCLYLGLYEGISGAENIGMFLVWLAIIVSPFLHLEDCIKTLKERGRTVPQAVNIGFDIAVVGMLVWNGFIITGALYFVHLVITEGVWKTVSESEAAHASANS